MRPGHGYLLIVGLAIIVGLTPALIWQLLQALRTRGGRRLHHWYSFGEFLYPVGVGCKGAAVGTLFMRYHLSDIGFPLFVALMLFRVFWRSYTKDNQRFHELSTYDQGLEGLSARQWTLLAALALSYSYECLTGLMYHYRRIKVQLVGSFDWWDMAFYTLGAGYGLCIMAIWQRQLLKGRQQYEAAQAEAAAQAAEDRQAVRRARRRTKPPRRSDGKRR